MNKFALYIFIVLIYLGLSKSFSPTEMGITYIPNAHVFSNYFEGSPLSVILIDTYTTGYLIKSYYHKYKLVYPFKPDEIVMVRTSSNFAKKNQENIGLSLFRRYEKDNMESTVPMPPGALFLDQKAFGKWVLADSGQRVWKFHRAYRNFPNRLGWGEFRPSLKFYRQMKIHLQQEKPYYGTQEQFGTNGTVTRENLRHSFVDDKLEHPDLEDFFEKHFFKNVIKSDGNVFRR